MGSHIGDIRDADALSECMQAARPEFVFHLAAQPLVRASYRDPIETYSTNVMGTLHVLEAARKAESVRVILNVTTDKCYENREWHWGYRENDVLGGHDPYSSSKACSEILTAAYRNSFFQAEDAARQVALASARAGNVIGGGDWAQDRLVPDCVRAVLAGESVEVRNPRSLRPWQHVLDPLGGYLLLAHLLYIDGIKYAKPYNFGPSAEDVVCVEQVVRDLLEKLGGSTHLRIQAGNHPHEAGLLMLDCSLARAELGWRPVWNLGAALDRTAEWVEAFRMDPGQSRRVCLEQIARYVSDMKERMP